MSADPALPLAHPPIVEAVVDIDCDMPVGFDLSGLEIRARERFSKDYPEVQTKFGQENSGIDALLFLKEDARQVIQVRRGGFSFNRLSPYTSLDHYLPEIERMWQRFVELTSPVQIQRIVLRYINRIFLPLVDGAVDLDKYLLLGPRLADEQGLQLLEFVNQYSALERITRHEINVSLLMQPKEGRHLPVIFDLEALQTIAAEPPAWQNVRETILSLRRLKNDVFRKTLTERCLNLFR